MLGRLQVPRWPASPQHATTSVDLHAERFEFHGPHVITGFQMGSGQTGFSQKGHISLHVHKLIFHRRALSSMGLVVCRTTNTNKLIIFKMLIILLAMLFVLTILLMIFRFRFRSHSAGVQLCQHSYRESDSSVLIYIYIYIYICTHKNSDNIDSSNNHIVNSNNSNTSANSMNDTTANKKNLGRGPCLVRLSLYTVSFQISCLFLRPRLWQFEI